jgi:hypothetical protein
MYSSHGGITLTFEDPVHTHEGTVLLERLMCAASVLDGC